MMTPRSRKPVLVVSGANIHNIPKLNDQNNLMSSLSEEKSLDNQCETTSDSPEIVQNVKTENVIPKTLQSEASTSSSSDSLTSTFREYLCSRSMLTASPADLSFSSRTDDYCSCDLEELNKSKLSSSLLHCLDGNNPCDSDSSTEEKELVLKPKQFDENGLPIVFETSF